MNSPFSQSNSTWLNKVPEATVGFWIIKIMSTTVGETVADYLAVSAGLGKPVTNGIMATLLTIALFVQLRSRHYTPWMYWLTVVLVSVVGTQITDTLTDGFKISLFVTTPIFFVGLIAIFTIWYKSEGTLSIHTITTRRRELFYWSCILCTFALGTAAGDLTTEALSLGFQLGTIAFGILIAITWIAFRYGANAVLTFWVAYILTRPLGASLGDLLSQAKTYGGLGLGAMTTSIIFLTVIVGLVTLAQIDANKSRKVTTTQKFD